MPPPAATSTWIPAFDACLGSDDLDGAVVCLDRLKTGHAGTAPQAVKDAAIRRLQHAYGEDSARVREVGLVLAASENPTAKEIGISLLSRVYDTAPVAIGQRLLRTGDDDNWEVREWAASALAHVISGRFELVLPRVWEWAMHRSPNVRRMAVVAAGYAMRDCTAAQCQGLLDLLTPLMADPDPYVGKNLGAFALGGYAVRYRPELVATWTRGLDLDHERTAWNPTMMFTTAEGAKAAALFPDVLAHLAQDERRRVKSAVSKAVANIAKRNPSAVTTLRPNEDRRGRPRVSPCGHSKPGLPPLNPGAQCIIRNPCERLGNAGRSSGGQPGRT